jgi:SAM-dependent methyltransferase
MSVFFYKVVYGLGLTPWERLAEFPAATQLMAFFDREERGRTPPFGRVLDLGCGTGQWSVQLARRGWQVTGVDVVAKAVHAAERRAREAGVEARFVHGDVAALQPAEIGTGFQLVLDIGTVHGIPPAQRAEVGQGVNADTEPGSVLLMYAFAPAHRKLLPRGASRAEIETIYPGWRVTDDLPFDETGLPESAIRCEPRWYRLVRE